MNPRAYSGREVQIAMAKEAVPGTLSDPTHNLVLDQRAFKRMIEKQTNRNSAGIRSGQFSQHIFREHSGGPLSGYVDADIMGLIGIAAFGKSPVSSGNRPARMHTWSGAEEGNALVQPFSIYRKTPNYQDAFKKCRPSKVMLKMMENSYAEYEMDFMGLKGESNAVALPSPPSQSSLSFFVPKNIEVKIAENAAGIAAAAPIRAKSCTVNYNAKVGGYPGLGDTDYVEIGSFEYDLNIELVLLLNNDVLRQLWISDEDRYIQIKMTGNEDLSTGGSSAKPVFTLKVPAAKVNVWDETAPNSEFAEQSLTLSGFYDAGIESTFSAILQNNTENY